MLQNVTSQAVRLWMKTAQTNAISFQYISAGQQSAVLAFQIVDETGATNCSFWWISVQMASVPQNKKI